MVTIRQVLKKYGVKKDEHLSTRTHRRYYKSNDHAMLKIELRYKQDKCVDATWTIWLRWPDKDITDDVLFDLNYLHRVGKNCVNDIKYALMLKEEKRQ